MKKERMRIYIIDTSSLIDMYRFFPADIFIGVWKKLDDIIQEKRLFILSQVRDEIKAKNDSLHHWMSTYDNIIIPTTIDLLIEVKCVLDKFPCVSDADSNKTPADPFLIAYVLHERKQVRLTQSRDFFIVTEEKKRKKEMNENTIKNAKKIPDICTYYNISCISLHDFFREEEWMFH
jgi:hypothetical protein